MKHKDCIKRVLVTLWMNGTAGRDILSGIFAYARSCHHWRIDLLQLPSAPSQDIVSRIRKYGLDGIIVSESSQSAVQKILAMTNAPLVSVRPKICDNDPAIRRISSVGCNDRTIGEIAARYFLQLGKFRSYGYVGAPAGISWSDERKVGFLSLLATKGEHVKIIHADHDGLYLNSKNVLGFLESLPKPTAIMSAFDGYGVQLLDICREAGIDVPKDVSVIGVDNDELMCDFSNPPLTSICPDHQQVGYFAARELDALMRTSSHKPQHIECKVKGIVIRSSVCSPPPSSELVRRALVYINQHGCEPIDVGTVAKQLGISRRLLDLRFRQSTKHSVLDAITEKRMRTAIRLLKDNRLTIGTIAKQSGYRRQQSFLAAFKRKFNTTPGSFKAANAETARKKPGTK